MSIPAIMSSRYWYLSFFLALHSLALCLLLSNLANQKSVLTNQKTVLANERLVLTNQKAVLPDPHVPRPTPATRSASAPTFGHRD